MGLCRQDGLDNDVLNLPPYGLVVNPQIFHELPEGRQTPFGSFTIIDFMFVVLECSVLFVDAIISKMHVLGRFSATSPIIVLTSGESRQTFFIHVDS